MSEQTSVRRAETGHKVILDTDPGIDDAMAIAYAVAHPDIDLLALTTIFGNVAVHEATANARALLGHLGSTAEVAEGADRPLVRPPGRPSYHVHGSNGFGEVALDVPGDRLAPLSRRTAAELIVELADEHPGEVHLCAVGPLTNLALALELDPGIVRTLASVTVMGGAVWHPGNVTPVAEANIWNDPDAADRVFAAEWRLTLAPLDCTMPVVFSRSYLDGLAEAAPRAGGLLREMGAFYTRFYHRFAGKDGCVPHDVAALMALTAPGAFTMRTGALVVATDGPAMGQTLFRPAGLRNGAAIFDGRPAHRVFTGTDAGMVLADYFGTLATHEAG